MLLNITFFLQFVENLVASLPRVSWTNAA